MQPHDLLDFIELSCFTRRWEKLGLNADDDLLALQVTIMLEPKLSPLISGTNSIRKLRFAPLRWQTGKSGATRVLYVYFESFGIVLLCFVYGKGEMGNISPAVKKHLNKLVEQIERELQRRQSL